MVSLAAMEYEDAISWIMSFWDPGRPKVREKESRALKVRRMKTLLDLLGSPQLRYPAILVAGTKGKGSTCAFIAEGLRAADLEVGRYTQPHLIDWRERTWVDGELISRGEVVALVERIKPVVESMRRETGSGDLTTYEIGTAVTLCYFADRGVDVAVLEIGIGGLLDALNVVDPVLSVITSISFDHTDVLGDTLAEIASEKSGIMRPGRPAVSSPQHPEAAAQLQKAASDLGATLYFVGRDWTWRPGAEAGTVDVSGPDGVLAGLPVPLLGDHQRDNATVAVAVLQLLRRWSAIAVDDGAIRRGIASVEWPGRVQRLRGAPLVVADAAHNVDSVQRLLETVRKEFAFRRMVLVFGASGEKDVDGMARVLGPAASEVIVTSSGHRRAAGIERLSTAFSPYAPVRAEPDPVMAFRTALDLSSDDDLVLITGSVFLAGRAIQAMSAG